MHVIGGFLVGCLDQAEGLARSLVEPVLVVRDSVALLNLHVLFVRTLDRLGGQAVDLVMNIHVQRHYETSSVASNQGPTRRGEQGAPKIAATESNLTAWGAHARLACARGRLPLRARCSAF